MYRSVIVCAALIALQPWASARAEPQPPLNLADCLKRPELKDEKAARAAAGVREGVAGSARLRCRIEGRGVPHDCTIVEEQPNGSGFGAAAQALASHFECKAQGQAPIKRLIDLPFAFDPVLPDSDLKAVRRPDLERVQAMYPAHALEKGIDGSAVVRCNVTNQGMYTGCQVVAESPENLGFGGAALLVMPGFQFRPPTKDGHFVAVSDLTRVHFETWGTGSVAQGSVKFVTPILYWDEAPTHAQMASVLPPGLDVATSVARVVFRCDYDKLGALQKCELIDVAPSGKSLDKAGRKLIPLFKVALGALPKNPANQIQVNLTIDFAKALGPGAMTPIEKAEWIRTPGGDLPFPGKAADAGLETGRAALDCVADARGMMTQCTVVSEDPVGMDFGVEALRVTAVMGVNPWTQDGAPTEGRHYKFAIRINHQEPAADPAKASAGAVPAKP